MNNHNGSSTAVKETTIMNFQTLQAENILLRQLGTRTGFFQYYFDQLPKHHAQQECFNAVNNKHFELFGEKKYNDFKAFREALRMG